MINKGLVELSSKLVSFNTVSNQSSTGPIADFIGDWLESCGFSVSFHEYETEKEGGAGIKLAKKNIIAVKGEGTPHLCYSGHMDTVSFNPDGWQGKDPLVLTRDGSNYHGLGIADMKIFLAMAMMAGREIEVAKLRKPFSLCFTSDEEVGCLGAKKLSETIGRVADYIVIGEPTLMKLIRIHKGYMYLEVAVAVRNVHAGVENSCHSSNPSTTTNAIEKILPAVVSRLSQFRSMLEGITDFNFEVPYPSMNIGGNMYVGRDLEETKKAAKNIIPRGFSILLEIRPIPGQDARGIKAALEAAIEDVVYDIRPQAANERIEVKVFYKRAPTPAMVTPEDSLIVRTIENLRGIKAGSVPYNTDGGVFNQRGSETVIIGPANIEQAHKDNEHVSASCFEQEHIDFYVELIKRMCY